MEIGFYGMDFSGFILSTVESVREQDGWRRHEWDYDRRLESSLHDWLWDEPHNAMLFQQQLLFHLVLPTEHNHVTTTTQAT